MDWQGGPFSRMTRCVSTEPAAAGWSNDWPRRITDRRSSSSSTDRCPRDRLIDPAWRALAGAFVSDLTALMGGDQVAVWIHGHTHRRVDVAVRGTHLDNPAIRTSRSRASTSSSYLDLQLDQVLPDDEPAARRQSLGSPGQELERCPVGRGPAPRRASVIPTGAEPARSPPDSAARQQPTPRAVAPTSGRCHPGSACG